MSIVFSAIIPASASDLNSPKLKDLIDSIKAQDFPQDQIEILVVTNAPIDTEELRKDRGFTFVWAESDSESAKGIGIKHARGEICAMFCADNMIVEKKLFRWVHTVLMGGYSAAYPVRYHYRKDDNSLNRYFSLIGGNDPVCYYLGKNDRRPHAKDLTRQYDYPLSYGCNGFFYRSELIKSTDLDHYYPMDNAIDVEGDFFKIDSDSIWHRTSDNLITFLKKRYRYARDLYCDRRDRRWKMFASTEDYIKLAIFCLYTLTAIQPLVVSARGFSRLRDWAWFWHWPICFGFLITYTILAIRNLFKHGRLFQCRPQASLSRP